jgi:threonylcarbamoyladenosine tRNA methylthiotransferase MtaB
LRLSSIEPWDFAPTLLNFWSDERLCRHLHIPLQSGNDAILRAMGRPISTNEYQQLINAIRDAVPDIAITTDVIAGFPGETDEDFEQTAALIRSIGFAGGHVFTYSPRPGTAAFKMKDYVPMQTAKARNAALRTIFADAGRDYRGLFIGTNKKVLWESSRPNQEGGWNLSGLTDNYIRVYTAAEDDLWNRITPVALERDHPARSALIGRLANLNE